MLLSVSEVLLIWVINFSGGCNPNVDFPFYSAIKYVIFLKYFSPFQFFNFEFISRNFGSFSLFFAAGWDSPSFLSESHGLILSTVWHYFLRVLIFAFFAGFFHDTRKKSSCEIKFPQKIYPQKFTPFPKIYANITFCTLLKPSLSFTNKTKLEATFRNKTMKLRSVHYKVFSC